MVCAVSLISWAAFLFVDLHPHYVANHGGSPGWVRHRARHCACVDRRARRRAVRRGPRWLRRSRGRCSAATRGSTCSPREELRKSAGRPSAALIELPLAALCFWIARASRGRSRPPRRSSGRPASRSVTIELVPLSARGNAGAHGHGRLPAQRRCRPSRQSSRAHAQREKPSTRASPMCIARRSTSRVPAMPVISPGLAAAPPTPSGHPVDVARSRPGGVVEQPAGGRVVLILPEHVMREEELSGAAQAGHTVAPKSPTWPARSGAAASANAARRRRRPRRAPSGRRPAQLPEPEAHEPLMPAGSMAPPRRKRAGRRAFLGEAQVGPGAALAARPSCARRAARHARRVRIRRSLCGRRARPGPRRSRRLRRSKPRRDRARRAPREGHDQPQGRRSARATSGRARRVAVLEPPGVAALVGRSQAPARIRPAAPPDHVVVGGRLRGRAEDPQAGFDQVLVADVPHRSASQRRRLRRCCRTARRRARHRPVAALLRRRPARARQGRPGPSPRAAWAECPGDAGVAVVHDGMARAVHDLALSSPEA